MSVPKRPIKTAILAYERCTSTIVLGLMDISWPTTSGALRPGKKAKGEAMKVIVTMLDGFRVRK